MGRTERTDVRGQRTEGQGAKGRELKIGKRREDRDQVSGIRD
jgi:hypothetical protein